MAWKADTFQGVLFLAPNSNQIDALEAWKLMSEGSNPESYQRPNISPISQSQASRQISGFAINISSQLGRVDIWINPNGDGEHLNAPPQFDSLEQPLTLAAQFMKAVLRECTVNRVAQVSALSIHKKDPHEATSAIEHATGIKFPNNSTDLIYQYNIRKQYACANKISMNRLHTFTSSVKQLISGHLDFTNPMSPQAFTPTIIVPVASLKLDLNSATATDVTHHASSMIDEHVKETLLIVSREMEKMNG